MLWSRVQPPTGKSTGEIPEQAQTNHEAPTGIKIGFPRYSMQQLIRWSGIHMCAHVQLQPPGAVSYIHVCYLVLLVCLFLICCYTHTHTYIYIYYTLAGIHTYLACAYIHTMSIPNCIHPCILARILMCLLTPIITQTNLQSVLRCRPHTPPHAARKDPVDGLLGVKTEENKWETSIKGASRSTAPRPTHRPFWHMSSRRGWGQA